VSQPLIDIMNLNTERYGLVFDYTDAMAQLSEELSEFTESHAKGDTLGMVDDLADIITAAVGQLTKLGFNPQLVLKQTVKHVHSRKIDPDKAEAFKRGELLKWPKDPNQNPNTIYEPNYNLCKLNKH